MTTPDEATRAAMRTGELYVDYGTGLEALEAERTRCQTLLHEFNHSLPTDRGRRVELLKELLGSTGENLWIEPPLRMAYGSNTSVGEGFYGNFNLVLVDDGRIVIGDRVMFAPNVTITATGHPIHPELRKDGTQFSLQVTVEDDVWVGSNVVIMPGVTIGAGSVIGAGSIVTKNVPPNVVAAGNPCRVLRPITDEDLEYRVRPPRDL